MIHPTKLNRIVPILILSAATASCGADRTSSLTDASVGREPASEAVKKYSGLSHLPQPQSHQALQRSLARHYPKQFVGLRPSTAVLVDVALDENGIVQDIDVIDRPNDPNLQVVLVDKAPGSNVEVERTANTHYDTAFGPAAIAALKDVRFLPALRDGKPVPFTMRMTIEFTSPS